MADCIIVGCDLHKKNMLLKIAADRETPVQRSFRNNRKGRQAMVQSLLRMAHRHGARRVVVVYEASCLGFGLHDELSLAAIECYVLAPSKIPRSWKHRCSKTDERDAQLLLELARAHVLAGNELPSVWVPDPRTRDDRELVRTRIDLGEKVTRVKNQLQSLLARCGLERPGGTGTGWTRSFHRWLDSLVGSEHVGPGASVTLSSLLAQLGFLETEVEHLDEHLARLAATERYRAAVAAMTERRGVGLLVALTFLVELGDLERFANRRRLASYLGLVPRTDESGEADDRKGHITRQGPPRVRKMLCQGVCSLVRWDPDAAKQHARLVGGRKDRKKKARVAMMRRLAIWLWHTARKAQRTQPPAAAPR